MQTPGYDAWEEKHVFKRKYDNEKPDFDEEDEFFGYLREANLGFRIT
jgi:hypothetical protein